jgi:hypothetical protein
MARMERFRWWVIQFIANAVVLASYLSYRYYLPEEESEWSTADKWIFFVPSVSAFLSLLGIFASVFQKEEDSVCRIESILVWAVTAVWSLAAILASVGPLRDREIISYESFIGMHPNLYFFSLLALVVAIILMASWFNQYIYGEDVEYSTSTQWILLGALSFLAMLSSISFRDSFFVEEIVQVVGNEVTVDTTNVIPICESGVYTCKRATFAIALSAVSAVIACFMAPWKGKSRKCQTDVGIALFIGWIAGVALITFGSGPGIRWGSLYFASYINLFLCLDIVIQSTAGSDGKTVPPSNRRSSAINRGAIFDAAYAHLERMNPDAQEKLDRSDSYKDLFESVALVSGSDDDGSEQVSGVDERSKFSKKYERSRVNRLELWCVLMIESCVNVAALIPNLSESGQRTSSENFVLMLPSMSIVVSFFGYASCMRKSKRSQVIQAASVRTIQKISFLKYSVQLTPYYVPYAGGTLFCDLGHRHPVSQLRC